MTAQGHAAARRVLRAAGLMILLLSVIGMHQLGGGGHREAAGLPMTMTAAAGPLPVHAEAAPAAAAAPARPVRPAVQLRAAGMSAIPACLAVLPSLLLLLAALAARQRAPLPRSSSSAHASRRPSGRVPPACSLEQLCVMRT